jgi:AcrR family transcriptional regulator
MPRWPPDARQRLEQAALELFAVQGYEHTTVAEIADRAGLKERSFYRYYTDKREVLSAGEELAQALLAAIAQMPDDLAPLDVLLGALPAAGDVLRPREFVRQLRDVTASSPALAERHLIKLAFLSETLAGALGDRGVDPQTAELCVTISMGVLNVATQRWIDEEIDFADAVPDISRRLVELIDATRAGATT